MTTLTKRLIVYFFILLIFVLVMQIISPRWKSVSVLSRDGTPVIYNNCALIKQSLFYSDVITVNEATYSNVSFVLSPCVQEEKQIELEDDSETIVKMSA